MSDVRVCVRVCCTYNCFTKNSSTRELFSFGRDLDHKRDFHRRRRTRPWSRGHIRRTVSRPIFRTPTSSTYTQSLGNGCSPGDLGSFTWSCLSVLPGTSKYERTPNRDFPSPYFRPEETFKDWGRVGK